MPSTLVYSSGSPSAVSALGVFVGSRQPPVRVLIALHRTSRDLRKHVTDSLIIQAPLAGGLITSSYKTPKSAAPVDAQDKVLSAVLRGQLETAVSHLRQCKAQGNTVEPYTVEQLIEGTQLDTCCCLMPGCLAFFLSLCFTCSPAEKAEVSGCSHRLQTVPAVSVRAVALLHIPVACLSCNQGMMPFASVTALS